MKCEWSFSGESETIVLSYEHSGFLYKAERTYRTTDAIETKVAMARAAEEELMDKIRQFYDGDRSIDVNIRKES